MKPPPGQLSLFELDARGEPLVPEVDVTQASPVIPPAPKVLAVDVPANHDESYTPAARNGDDPLALLAGYLTQLAGAPPPAARVPSGAELRQARDDWLRRLQTSRRSKSTLTAYRVAIDDLLDWSSRHGRNVFEEATIVDHLAAYQRRAQPAPATYYRRFGLLRRFVHWLSRRSGLPDPFLELEPPSKPQQEADWLTEDEFAQLLAAAEHPRRRRRGLAERDRLVLLALVQTSLRRSELTALDWCDVDLESERPSLLVRRGKGAKPRRQPLAPQLANELRQLRNERRPAPTDPVFCGLEGKRLQPTILAGIISRAAERAGLTKRVTAHPLRHTAATWLRQQTGDARLVAAYLGHADLSTVSRYAHVAEVELYEAATVLAKRVEIPVRQRAA
jgi:site-specific recombinase XerD